MVRRLLYRMFYVLCERDHLPSPRSVDFANSVTYIFSAAFFGVLLHFVTPGDHAPY